MQHEVLNASPITKLMDHSLDLICNTSSNGTILYINSAAHKLLGYHPWELEGTNIYDLIYPFDKALTITVSQKSIEEGEEVINFSNRYIRKDGSLIDLEWTATFDPEEQKGYCVGRDISKRKAQERKLLEQQQKLAMASSLAGVGYWQFDVLTQERYFSDKAYEIYGIKKGNIHSSFEEYLEMVHPDDRVEVASNMATLYLYDQSEHTHRLVQPSGKVIYVHNVYGIEKDEQGNLLKLSGVVKDVTETLTLEQNRLKQKEEYKRQLTRAVIEGQEKERTKIGIDLHDNVNQILTTVKLYTELCLSDQYDTKELQKKSVQYLTTCINEIRSISKALSAPTIGEISFTDSLNELIQSIEETNQLTIVKHFDGITDTETIPQDLQLAVYRIVQEQLTNVLKHAHATQAIIEVERKGKSLSLMVKDDGVGFDMEKKRGGIGIKNICTRAEAFGGKAQIRSAEGKGCTVTCLFDI